jgi:hypothetical protein
MKAGLARVASIAAALCLGAAALPVAAHHSTAMFDADNTVSITGTVKEVHWANPHAVIFIENTDPKGAAAGVWVVELASPRGLIRAGWTRNAVKPGDKVTADVHQLRDGSRGGSLRRISLTGAGQTYAFNIRDQEQPTVALEPAGK